MKRKHLHFYLRNNRWPALWLLIFLLTPWIMAKANPVVRIGFTDAKVIPALKRIEALTEYRFIYNREDIDQKMRVNIPEKERTVSELMKEVSKQAKLNFKIIDDIIAIAPSSDKLQSSSIKADPIEVKGRITDSKGQALPGATIQVKGSNEGTTSDLNGNFSLRTDGNNILVISFTGFITQEIALNNRTSISISLAEDSKVLGEVVVTALGVRKERKALGYSVTEVKGEELTKARETNVANALVGKVAGVSVNSIAGGPGASTSVIIRGVSSLSQTNQPLYVINGIPLNNNVFSVPGKFGEGGDSGDGIGNINPDDIESMTVLKGAAASALYGSRAKAGVILVTTKSGSGKGSIEFNTNYVAEQVVNVTDFQYEFGSGSNGIKPSTADAALDAGRSSWGARMDGSPVIQFDGVTRPYSPQEENIQNFYGSGGTFTNTLSFSKGFEAGGIRFSVSDLHNNSVIPNAGMNRQTINLSTNYNLTKGLTLDVKANYIIEQVDNRPYLSDSPGNPNFGVMFLPTSVDVNMLKPGSTPDRKELSYVNDAFTTNPWFAANNFINDSDRNRLIGVASLRYALEDGFFIQGRVGRDAFTDRLTKVVPNGTAYRDEGSMTETTRRFSELNTDILIGKAFQTGNFTITPNVGANLMKQEIETSDLGGGDFATRYLYSIGNTQTKTVGFTDLNQEIQSVYATAEVGFKNFLYLNASARNDWFSTLAPSDDLDVLYPSVSASFVFSELMDSDLFSFGKFRIGYASVGQATDPYKTLLYYKISTNSIGGFPIGNISNQDIPNSTLVPSLAKEFEVGTELRFLNDRLSLDLTWYNKKSQDEILLAPASISSGYNSVVLNIGELRNKGFELLLEGSPVKSDNFSWTSSLNGSINNNEVISLAAEQASLAVLNGESRSENGFVQQIVGKAANQVMAFDYEYDASGNIVVNPQTGVPERGELKPWGSAFHKWTGGWNNTFNYKGVNLSFLIDGKFGGKIFSATDYYAYIEGLHKATLDRERTFGSSNVSAQVYYSGFANNVSRQFVQDAGFIKFREASLGYSFPAKVFNNVIQGATLSLVGRNLFTIMKDTDNIDPESNYNGVAQGLELGGVPPVRTFGFNLNVRF
ncbi:SusC/RagA family TonB-linked outer membrane protein [Flavihumibacter sp. R14]|nr:SusC/RagA family TonB-linked outer membrane protein [Flavihumibacter soli]